jgi:uncharacterized protein (DUF1330 family)
VKQTQCGRADYRRCCNRIEHRSQASPGKTGGRAGEYRAARIAKRQGLRLPFSRWGFQVITQRPTGGADVAKELGGHYIARTDKITTLDGSAPQRFIAYAFDSVEKAQAFNNSPYMKEVNAIRGKTTQARSFMVEGMPQ